MEKEKQKQKRLPRAQGKHGDPYELAAGEQLSGKAQRYLPPSRVVRVWDPGNRCAYTCDKPSFTNICNTSMHLVFYTYYQDKGCWFFL